MARVLDNEDTYNKNGISFHIVTSHVILLEYYHKFFSTFLTY